MGGGEVEGPKKKHNDALRNARAAALITDTARSEGSGRRNVKMQSRRCADAARRENVRNGTINLDLYPRVFYERFLFLLEEESSYN